jgi:pimeloyl-ACP methyl ester carboxylesterase
MIPIYYEEHGEGQALVFLHGFCESHEIWEKLIPDLSNHFRVITLDLPGFGKSQLPKTSFTIKEVGQAVIELIELLGITKCVVVGHSLGGYIALALAEEKTDLVKGLCLFHSTAQGDSEEKKLNRNKVMAFVNQHGVQPFTETFVPGLFFKKDHENIEKVYKIAAQTSKKSLLAYSMAMRDRPDMTNFLKSFLSPVLFIGGEKDSIIPISTLQNQVKLMPTGKLIIMMETGHMGMFEDATESIRLLEDFAESCFRPERA